MTDLPAMPVNYGEKKYSAEQTIKMVQDKIAIAAAEGCAYDSWTDDYRAKNIKEVWRNERGFGNATIKPLTRADIMTMSPELRLHYFGVFDDDLDMLIPIWLINYIADGEVFSDIRGGTLVKGKDELDMDHRWGFLAFGWSSKYEIIEGVKEEILSLE